MGKCKFLPARYVLAVLGSIGMAIVYGLKVNLSVTMVAMLNHTATGGNQSHDHNNGCDPPPGSSNQAIEDGPFAWGETLQGLLLSCYFWGYLVALLPGGWLAERLSAKWVMFFAVAMNVVCTLLTPILTKFHWGGLVVMRILEGVGGGVTFPAMHCMIATWSPPNERSTLSTIVYVGTSFGTAISILMAGALSSEYGWESVFYIMGGLSAIWMLLWVVFVSDTPEKAKLISEEERQMIKASLGTSKSEAPPFPLKEVMKSVPFWAIFIAHLCGNWGWYMFLIEVPFYMKQVLKFNVAGNAIASALPFFPLLVFSLGLGKIFDVLITKDKLSVTAARKIATGIASLVPSACLVGMCFIGCRHMAAVGLMSVGIIGSGAMFCGYLSNHIDIAPPFAGTLVAITNTFATIPGILVPIFVGYITQGNQTIDAWRIVFYVTTALFLVEFVVFTIFGSGKEQPWAKGERSGGGEETPLREKDKKSEPLEQ